jgi:hypothetical protein
VSCASTIAAKEYDLNLMVVGATGLRKMFAIGVI